MLLGDLIGEDEPINSAWRGINIRGLTCDSRDVQEGFLFAALPGSKLDGSRFIADACRRKAAAILSDAQCHLPVGLGVPVILSNNPRRSLAFISSKFYADQPDTIVAVTGTNGKTSVSVFLRQIWQSVGFRAASLGTTGLATSKNVIPLQHTLPEPIKLHRYLSHLSHEKITHVALEASSHGLAQYRVDAVCLSAAAFTNLTFDHVDYHGSFENYLAQKLRLFTEILDQTGVAVINADAAYSERFITAATERGIRVITVGRSGTDLVLLKSERTGLMHVLNVRDPDGMEHSVSLPLVGDFQISNALVAVGLAIACGIEAAQALSALAILEGVIGRLEMVGETRDGASIFIDYAHTPDALRTILTTLRPYTRRRLIIVFGAGGDRDREKRPQMGQIAGEYADIVIVTDDNPRGENPAEVRSQVLDAVPDAIEIGDRRTAIAAGIKMLRAGDVLVIAGKGHETEQCVGNMIIPFSDHDSVSVAIGDIKCRA